MPGRWLVLTVRVPSDELTAELAGGLVALGGGAVQEEDGRLTTYFPPPPDPDAFRAHAAAHLAVLADREPELFWDWRPDEDWSRSWREGLAPRRVGRRLIVCQPWNVPEVAEAAEMAGRSVSADAAEAAVPGPVVIVIDPATAFGTGEHATTRGALRLMETLLRGGERVLDVGTGSGILALAAAALGATRVLAVESDPDAMSNARENLDRSAWSDRIELVNAVVDEDYLASHREDGFDLIVANVLSGVLTPLLPAFAAALAATGRVVLGGILDEESDAVVAAGHAAGLSLEAEDREEGWGTAQLRPSA
jgi:ribosomal protein L11 methyltransferase